jgi:superfamily II helicase
MSDVEDALSFVDCSYIAADNSVIFPEANRKLQRTIKTALQEQAEREKGCDLCNLTFDSADQLMLELKKDGYGDCTICPRCGRDLRKPVQK